MFALIPYVMVIILAGTVLGAYSYFGGDIFPDSAISADATAYINEASQVKNASQVFRINESAWPTAVSDLTSATPTYLNGGPSGTYVINGTTGEVTAVTGSNPGLTAEICGKIQESATGSDVVAASQPTDQLYGCWESTAGTEWTLFHK